MPKIESLTLTCEACPTQYEGTLDDGRMIYVRYRWGYLSIRVSPVPTRDSHEAVAGTEVYGCQIGEDLDGLLEHAEIMRHLLRAGYEPPGQPSTEEDRADTRRKPCAIATGAAERIMTMSTAKEVLVLGVCIVIALLAGFLVLDEFCVKVEIAPDSGYLVYDGRVYLVTPAPENVRVIDGELVSIDSLQTQTEE